MTKNPVWSKKELASIQNKDRLLPSQPYFSKMYKGKDFYGDMEALLFSMHSTDEEFFDIKTKDGMTYAAMGSEINTLKFYQFLIRSHRYRSVLELGTYIGVSAMFMAHAGALVTTLEKGEEFTKIAKRNIKANGFAKEIAVINDDAVDFMKLQIKSYDLIVIDCAKESYDKLLKLALPMLANGGMILVDDIFFQGDTLGGKPKSKKGIGVMKMLNYAATLNGYEKVILPIGNGLLMIRKF